ncbi:MAG: U32 family peptidase, partial [Peptococcaceae bacterium]|nr:U32 family peptidase [Peptococcaceae bacterium]
MTDRRKESAIQVKPVTTDEFQQRWSSVAQSTKTVKSQKTKLHNTPELSVTVGDILSLEAAVRGGANIVYFGGEQYRSKEIITPEIIKAAGNTCRTAGVKLLLSAPRIIKDRELTDYNYFLESLRGFIDGVLVTGLGQLNILRETTDILIHGDYSLNVFNRESALFLMEAGIDRVTLSPELTMEQLSSLAASVPVATEVLVHGAIPLMVSEHCPLSSILGESKNCNQPCRVGSYGLRDRKNIVFPLEMDQYCRMHLFNSKDLCVINDVGKIAFSGVTSIRIEARRANHGYVGAAVKAYRAAIENLPIGLEETDLVRINERLAKHSPAGFTKGHYYRGV